MRIAIIGAGVAGLTAAESLRRSGFSEVVVYEAAQTVGGKVRTKVIDGRPYELGACVFFKSDTELVDLIDRYGVLVSPSPHGRLHDLDDEGALLGFRAWQNKRFSAAQTAAALARYMFVIARYPEVAKSGGWSSLPHELFESSDAFFAKHGLSAVAWPYRHWMAGLGYGFHSEMPALYSMSFIGRGLLLKMLRTVFDLDSGFRTVAPGFQKLWEAVARDLDIRLNHPVTAVRRRAKGQGWTIHVTSNGQTETFDRLITTVSHPRMLEVLDPSEAERAVYGRIRFNPYVTTVFRARGLAEGSTALLAQQCTPDRKGRLMMYSHPHPDRDLFLGWQYGLETDAPALSAAVFEDVAELGGEVLKIVHQEFWPDYFPHVEEEGLRAGHFEELQAMQGQRGTYYAGAMVDCELTGTVAAWAKKLVNTYFTNA